MCDLVGAETGLETPEINIRSDKLTIDAIGLYPGQLKSQRMQISNALQVSTLRYAQQQAMSGVQVAIK